MNRMLWREEVIGINIFIALLFSYNLIRPISLYLIKKCNNERIVLSYVWSDVILLVCITLFCDQGCKSESLEIKIYV